MSQVAWSQLSSWEPGSRRQEGCPAAVQLSQAAWGAASSDTHTIRQCPTTTGPVPRYRHIPSINIYVPLLTTNTPGNEGDYSSSESLSEKQHSHQQGSSAMPGCQEATRGCQAARGQASSTACPKDSVQPVANQAACNAMSGSQTASGQGTSQPDAQLSKQCTDSARLSQEPSHAASRQGASHPEIWLSQQCSASARWSQEPIQAASATGSQEASLQQSQCADSARESQRSSQAASGQGARQPESQLSQQCSEMPLSVGKGWSQEPSQAASRQEVKQQESQLSQQFYAGASGSQEPSRAVQKVARRQASSIASSQETK